MFISCLWSHARTWTLQSQQWWKNPFQKQICVELWYFSTFLLVLILAIIWKDIYGHMVSWFKEIRYEILLSLIREGKHEFDVAKRPLNLKSIESQFGKDSYCIVVKKRLIIALKLMSKTNITKVKKIYIVQWCVLCTNFLIKFVTLTKI